MEPNVASRPKKLLKENCPCHLEIKPLGFPYEALEPNIDKQTMEIHHGKHYAAYVNNYNAAISKSAPQLDGKPLHEVLANNLAAVPEDIKTAVRNNGGGAHNHALFWEILNPAGKPGTEPVGKLADAIKSTFGDFAKFKEKFAAAGTTRFGSGWAWLIKKGDKLEVISTANQDSPLMDGALPDHRFLDVWEHAYYCLSTRTSARTTSRRGGTWSSGKSPTTGSAARINAMRKPLLAFKHRPIASAGVFIWENQSLRSLDSMPENSHSQPRRV